MAQAFSSDCGTSAACSVVSSKTDVDGYLRSHEFHNMLACVPTATLSATATTFDGPRPRWRAGSLSVQIVHRQSYKQQTRGIMQRKPRPRRKFPQELRRAINLHHNGGPYVIPEFVDTVSYNLRVRKLEARAFSAQHRPRPCGADLA